MAPLPQSNTARLKVLYENAQAGHNFVVRVADVADVAALEGAISVILTTLTGLYDFSEVTGVQFAAEGSDLFFPHPPGLLDGFTWGSGAATPESNATALTFTGRSLTGRRARFSVFGYSDPLSQFRLTAAEDSRIGDVVEIMQAVPERFIAIDGNLPTWNPYANVRAFDHWIDEARS